MEAIIRKAKPEELKVIQDLNYALFRYDENIDPLFNFEWPYQKEGDDYFRRMISGEIGVCFVAEVGGEIVGYLAGSIKIEVPSYRPTRRSELENMFVKEQFRSKGIGGQLAKTFLQWSKDNGITRVFVSTNWQHERTIAFYERMGFEKYSIVLEADLSN